MKLIVGLGNPGEKHKNNRHNVGFMIIDEIRDEILLMKPNEERRCFEMQEKFNTEIFKLEKIILIKPQTYMNSSGKTVKKILDHFKIKTSDLWVIHDDLDIPLGDFKIQKGKGPKLHKGVMSIEKELGKSDFWRVRVGVENRDSKNRIPGEAYVLQDFKEEEREIVKSVIKKISKEVLSLINE